MKREKRKRGREEGTREYSLRWGQNLGGICAEEIEKNSSISPLPLRVCGSGDCFFVGV